MIDEAPTESADAGLARRAPALRWRAAYAPAALLVAVALHQIVLVETRDLTPWKGGGFGMFSTADTPFARFLRVRLVVDGRELPVAIPSSLKDAAQAVRVLPTQERLDALSTALARGEWIRDDATLLDDAGREQLVAQLVGANKDRLDATVEEIERIFRARMSRARGATSLRMIDRRDAVPATVPRVLPAEVSVELWRYRFDAGARRLLAWKMRAARGVR
jgi:hypothetical protein